MLTLTQLQAIKQLGEYTECLSIMATGGVIAPNSANINCAYKAAENAAPGTEDGISSSEFRGMVIA